MRKYYQTFTVTTKFQFPIDMLRYDGCFPHTEIDAGAISRNLTDQTRPITVQIGRYVTNKRMCEPTIERWASFGCKVSEVYTR